MLIERQCFIEPIGIETWNQTSDVKIKYYGIYWKGTKSYILIDLST